MAVTSHPLFGSRVDDYLALEALRKLQLMMNKINGTRLLCAVNFVKDDLVHLLARVIAV